MPDDQREGLQEELIDIILHVLKRNPQLHYYQGYHDIVVTFLLVVGDRLATALVEKLSTHHLRYSETQPGERSCCVSCDCGGREAACPEAEPQLGLAALYVCTQGVLLEMAHGFAGSCALGKGYQGCQLVCVIPLRWKSSTHALLVVLLAMCPARASLAPRAQHSASHSTFIEPWQVLY